MRFLFIAALISLLAGPVYSQSMESDLEAEINSVQGKPEISPPAVMQPSPTQTQVNKQMTSPAKKSTLDVDQELAEQEAVIKRKQLGVSEIGTDRNLNRYPHPDPTFKKPPGPPQGGTVKVEHPRAAQGLLRINKDGSYQYKTAMKEKSKSSSFKLGMMTPPKVDSGNSNITFESMYGSNNVFALNFDYEWQPFRSFGSLGFRLGTGLSTVTAAGYFKNQDAKHLRSEEKYTLFIVPLSAFINYRFEFARRQWIVPYVTGGATYYGLMELRNDNAAPSFAAAPAAGGGGGLMFNVSRLDAQSAFNLSQEYGIADMWLTVEAIAMQGLSNDIDFSNQLISAGIQVDF